MRSGAFFLSVCLAIFTIILLPGDTHSEELVIVGTGAGMPVLEGIGKAFTRENPGMNIVVPKSIGSGGAIKAVGTDAYIAGRVARDISGNEKKYDLIQYALAKLPIVFYVNDSVSLTNINPEQVCSIYSGSIRWWEDLGGGKGLIRVIRREEGDSSLKVLLKTISGFKEITQTQVSKVTYTDQETIDACVHQENSIAYGTLSDVKDIGGIHVLSIGDIAPSNPDYPHFGPLALVYKKKNFTGTLRKFVEFISSDSAKKAIFEAGALPAN